MWGRNKRLAPKPKLEPVILTKAQVIAMIDKRVAALGGTHTAYAEKVQASRSGLTNAVNDPARSIPTIILDDLGLRKVTCYMENK